MRSRLRLLVSAICTASTLWVADAVSGPEDHAIAAVRPLVAKSCSSDPPCRFVAKRSGDGWEVYVGYRRYVRPGDPPTIEPPGAFTVFLLDQDLNVIKTIPGE